MSAKPNVETLTPTLGVRKTDFDGFYLHDLSLVSSQVFVMPDEIAPFIAWLRREFPEHFEQNEKVEKTEPPVESRHLRIEWGERNVASGCEVYRIVEQTHRGDQFTPNGWGFAASNGVKLFSVCSPAYYRERYHLCVRGSESHRDNDTFEIPASHVERVNAAVAEYNEKFGGKKKTEQPIASLNYEPKMSNAAELIEQTEQIAQNLERAAVALARIRGER